DYRFAINRCHPFQKSAVNTAFTVVAGFDEPVVRRTFPFLNLPMKCVGVEFGRPFGVVGVNLEMYNSCHSAASPSYKFLAVRLEQAAVSNMQHCITKPCSLQA